MAQTEDTELRDLVIEALEKNGSLAKIRALLRANIFLAFEDEYENVKQNVNLDSIMKIPEGVLALTIVHEFLESCNLKNTLFVYTSESRQGKEYNYEGKKLLADKLCLNKQENTKEPVLVTLIKNYSKFNGIKKQAEHNFNKTYDKKPEDRGDTGKDEQNNSYIIHEDSPSSTTNTSQSDNSSDEKNKLHLRLQLDNSDTDTSSDSTRDKSASEYIPSDHVIEHDTNTKNKDLVPTNNEKNMFKVQEVNVPSYFSKIVGNSSSESTSYIDLKPFSALDEKMLNTTGLPQPEVGVETKVLDLKRVQNDPKIDSAKSATLSSISSLSLRNESERNNIQKNKSVESAKSDGDTDYSNDFTISQTSKNRDSVNKIQSPPDSTRDFKNDINKIASSPITSPHQNSQSSISISDVADLISEKSSSFEKSNNEHEKSKNSRNSNSKKQSNKLSKIYSDDSGDFTESPVPSLSNLSLDIHSD